MKCPSSPQPLLKINVDLVSFVQRGPESERYLVCQMYIIYNIRMIQISYCHRTKTKAWRSNNVLIKGFVLYMQKVNDDNILWLLLASYLTDYCVNIMVLYRTYNHTVKL